MDRRVHKSKLFRRVLYLLGIKVYSNRRQKHHVIFDMNKVLEILKDKVTNDLLDEIAKLRVENQKLYRVKQERERNRYYLGRVWNLLSVDVSEHQEQFDDSILTTLPREVSDPPDMYEILEVSNDESALEMLKEVRIFRRQNKELNDAKLESDMMYCYGRFMIRRVIENLDSVIRRLINLQQQNDMGDDLVDVILGMTDNSISGS